jgi:riboflavin biosynthesis pyrimidine reductase
VIRSLFGPGQPAGEGPLQDEDLERLYAPPPGRHLRANFLATFDGAVEFGGTASSLGGGDDDLRVFMTLRALADVVVVGAGTLRAEDYGPSRLSPERAARRRERGDRRLPTVAVFTSTAQVNPAARLFREHPASDERPRPIVVTCEAAGAEQRKALAEVAEVLVAGDRHVELRTGLDQLAALGLTRQLCEGGPTLFSSFLNAGLVNELCLTIRTALAGPGHAGLTHGPAFDGLQAFDVEQLLAGDGVLFGRYRPK